jgi:hypothetical protein
MARQVKLKGVSTVDDSITATVMNTEDYLGSWLLASGLIGQDG